MKHNVDVSDLDISMIVLQLLDDKCDVLFMISDHRPSSGLDTCGICTGLHLLCVVYVELFRCGQFLVGVV